MLRFTTVPLPRLQALNARTMQAALQESAQATIHTDADAARLVAFRERHADLSLEAIVARAVVRAFEPFPHINARISVEGLSVYHSVHLGLMVVLDKGVIVPVIDGAEQLSLREMDGALGEIAEKARTGGLRPSDTRSTTFTIASLADHGVDHFTPILVAGMVATLGIGRIRRVCEPHEEGCRPGHQIALSLTFDHRAIHGVEAARFLAAITDGLGDPEGLA